MDGSKYSFRKLTLWEKAQELTLAIVKLTGPLPRGAASDVIARQIIRSSSSIGANIAEGHGRFTPRAHAQHLSIAKGSACETDSWLDLLVRTGMIQREEEARLHALCDEIIAMLTAKIRDLDKVEPRRLRDEPVPWDYTTSDSQDRF